MQDWVFRLGFFYKNEMFESSANFAPLWLIFVDQIQSVQSRSLPFVHIIKWQFTSPQYFTPYEKRLYLTAAFP